jgi:pilus assembly protein Flp/PilA
MAEYGLLVLLIAVVVVPALIVLGPVVAGWYTGVVASL